MTTKILVYGAGGSQMGAATDVLIESGYDVRVFTRSDDKASAWRAKGAEAFVGDMAEFDVMRRASDGCDAIFLLIPTFRDSDLAGANFGLNAIEAARQAGITKIVWNTSVPMPKEGSEEAKTSPVGQVLQKIKDNKMSYLALQPVIYMENLFGPWTTERLMVDVVSYPTPVEFQIQWIAARDFGVVAAAALKDELPNEVHVLGGPTAMNGLDVAAAFSALLKRTLTYETTSVETFKAYLEKGPGPVVANMIGGLYAAIQADPVALQPGFVVGSDALEKRFGIKLTSLEEWLTLNRAAFSGSID